MKIKFLSESTINKIAAGEVIERPASVIKELVENAIDAGASKIDIILEQAGKNLIIIADDGLGMSPEELEIAIQRHTTSKLDETDLLNINSFGFRGEALPSIAAISKLLITSKTKESDKAFQIQLIGGNPTPVKPTTHNRGTKIEVRDLFFATPARLKFLKSDNAELAACVDCVKKIALAHPNIAFNLSNNGKNIIKVKQAQHNVQEQASKQRITEIMSEAFIENAAMINLQHDILAITGYTSIPTNNKATASEQFLFVNNRPIKDKILNTALRIAYQDYLARDRHPIVVIFMQIDPQFVDVNVHPAKSEVRFQDPNLVRSLLVNAIRDALFTVSNQTSTTIADAAIDLFTTPLPDKKVVRQQNPRNYHVFDYDSIYRNMNAPTQLLQSKLLTTSPQALVSTEAESNNDNIDYPLGAAKTQLHDTYIIAQTQNSIIIVDQHAADERLGYERIKQSLNNNGLIKQRLLIPEIVELASEILAEQFFAHQETLAELGLTVEKFGERSIIVSEIPSLVGDIDIKKLIFDLAEHINETGTQSNLTELIEHITETYACHYAIRAGRKLSITEMNELLRQMEKTPFSGQCNHGRPTYIELKLKDIEKLFGRR
ncbi:DNA mismatch repair protein MutL [Candidatus Trichorickettsia mobilis]|uniref:DNA mismatch repair protein MutL n=1 Tax=Candidatus Trichorickettsia mobilis TaxID=1346319 RepID=A0ABZ0UQ90_9RICK|nr:DNA mismatch repair endonuclease MutL [Candidatus Trichorickettsia mobilis]WPY00213.1 DNA mismatch repair protein MutL [Candidatus Trichorickettsia mobilis]